MNLHDLAAQQRRDILRREQQLADSLDSAYGQMWRSLVHTLLRLLDQMQRAEAAAKAAGLSFNPTLYLQQIRGLDALLIAVQDDMNTFVETARTLLTNQMLPSWQIGQDDALALLRASLPPGLDIQFGRPSIRAFDLLAGRDYWFKGMTADAVLAVRRRLLAGLALGQGPREVARSIELGLRDVSRNRAQVIARSEMIDAYRSAAINTYQENSDVVRGWIWRTAEDERTCPLCRPMDGKKFTLSTPFESKHPQDRCTPIPDTYGYDEILARFAA